MAELVKGIGRGCSVSAGLPTTFPGKAPSNLPINTLLPCCESTHQAAPLLLGVCVCGGGGGGKASLASCYAKLLPSTSVKSMQFPTAENQISSLNLLHYTSQRTAQNRAAMHKPTAES